LELKDFVSTTLKEIEAALSEAQKTGSHIYYVSPNVQGVQGGIKFDLAVTSGTTSEGASNVGGGLRVKVISAEIGKTGKSTISAETTSRIVFTVNPRNR
jgi:hypothetical protein